MKDIPNAAARRDQAGELLEGDQELGAAVRVAGVVHRVDADEDVVGAQNLGITEGQGEQDGIAGRHIGHGNAPGSALRHVDVVGQGGATNRT